MSEPQPGPPRGGRSLALVVLTIALLTLVLLVRGCVSSGPAEGPAPSGTYSSSASSCGSSSSFADSSSTFTSLNVSTRTLFTNRSAR